MSRLLITIDPETAQKIIKGEKKYEYTKFHHPHEFEKIIIRVSAPVNQIIGEIEVKEVITGEKTKIWEETKENSGITKEEYEKYYENKETAVVYRLGKVMLYEIPIDVTEEDFASF